MLTDTQCDYGYKAELSFGHHKNAVVFFCLSGVAPTLGEMNGTVKMGHLKKEKKKGAVLFWHPLHYSPSGSLA